MYNIYLKINDQMLKMHFTLKSFLSSNINIFKSVKNLKLLRMYE